MPATASEWQALSAASILRNNIFGVDISPESVEIAQLSLWIRTARRGQPLADLSANVLCGNSIVDDHAIDPVSAFDWRQRFSKVFARDGFDAVVGNPPYVRQERLAALKPYLAAHYRSHSGAADLYVYFYERGLDLLRPTGRLAFISSGTFVKGAFADPLRILLSTEASLESLIDFGEFQPFPDAEMVRPSCIVFRKGKNADSARILKILRERDPAA